MALDAFLRLLKQHLLWFILLPILTTGVALYMTRNEPKVYKSQATLYTGLASGYNLLSDQQSSFIDRSTTAFDNLLTTLMSKETLLQVGVSLLADHLPLQSPDSLVLGGKGFQQLRQGLPPSWRDRLLASTDSASLRRMIDSLARTPTDNPVKSLLLTSDSPYSVRRLTDKLKGTGRKNTNDVLLLEYEADDPAVAQRTLHYVVESLNKRNSYFKTSETNSVVGYYEQKLNKAKEALTKAENALRDFTAKNQVLDYDEEARNMASAREGLVNEYNQELGRKNAAEAAITALKRRTGSQSTIRNATNDLNERQKKLTEAESQLANARAYGQPKETIARLQANVNRAADDLKASAQKYDAATNTSDAVSQQTVGNELMTKNVEFEESSARLELYKKRINDYQAKTDLYGPLGSQLRDLNRNLAIAEKEYLALLQNVEQSRTRRQDVSIGGTLEVVDAPDFPLLPQPSKRGLLIAIAIGVGIFLALLFTALRFWLDRRINSPEQAELLIGQPITALFPTVNNPLEYSKTSWAALCMFEQLSNAINIEVSQVTGKPYPPVINLISGRAKQGKSWVADGLIRLYQDADQKVAYCYPRQGGKEPRRDQKGITWFPYTVRPDFMNLTSVDYLLDLDHQFDASQYDRILLELPSLLDHQLPVYLVKNSAVSVLIIDAGSSWARAEKQLLNQYIRVTNHPVLTVLNRVGGDHVVIPNRAEIKKAMARPERFQPHQP